MRPYFENKNKKIFISYYNKTYNYPSHFHNHLELVYCFSGSQKVKVGEMVYTLKKGEAVVIFPNTIHEYIEDNTAFEDSETLAIICDTNLLNENLPDIIKKYPTNPLIKPNMLSGNTVYAFKKVLTVKNDIELLGWTYIILSDLICSLKLTSSRDNLELPSKIISYIDSNFKEPLSINFIAREFGYHPSYIAHLFSDRLKIAFKTYLGGVRSEYAAYLIRTTDKTLTEIAYDSGYNSVNTFCRSFKKHFFKTPSQYKKSQYLLSE